MENLILPSPPLFLLLVDISKPMEMIKEELLYQWHFIDNQAQKATAPPHVLLGGSHKRYCKAKRQTSTAYYQKRLLSTIYQCYLSLQDFITGLQKTCILRTNQIAKPILSCKVLTEAVDITLHCHILKTFLITPVFKDKNYCKVSDIVDQIETSDTYIPQHSLELILLLQVQRHIPLLENHTDKNQNWVTLKPEVLLTDVKQVIKTVLKTREDFSVQLSR